MQIITFNSQDKILDPVEVLLKCFLLAEDSTTEERINHNFTFAGQLPVIHYKNKIIPRHKILPFMKKAIAINERLNIVVHQIQLLERLMVELDVIM